VDAVDAADAVEAEAVGVGVAAAGVGAEVVGVAGVVNANVSIQARTETI
jgi:hypothetical protein